MKISYNWLREYIDIELGAHALAEKITSVGLEVEEVTEYNSLPKNLVDFTIGHVKEVWQHPNADRLRVTKVDIGAENLLQIVCGAPNVAEGQKVVVATVGTQIQPLKGESFIIKASKIRGEASEGMICAEDELGIGEDHNGILVLPADAPLGKPFTEFLNPYSDFTIEIGLTPNRADAASHIGVARDLAALFNRSVKTPVVNKNWKTTSSDNNFSIEIAEPELCPRYAGVIIKNVEVKDSPEWLQNKLKAAGINPINNIVDATNFVMYELGQPLHAFDLSKIDGNKIVVKKSAAGSTFITLDKQERKLDGTELMICNANEPMALAGVFGGLKSGINSETKDIFIESAYFSPKAIRNTARKHGLFTDASFRYERGADPNICLYALYRITEIIIQIAGGEIQLPAYDVYPNPIKETHITLPYKMLDTIAGMVINRNEVKDILQGLQIQIVKEETDALHLSVPTFKYDVTRPIDVIEEILRIYSFDKIPVPQTVNSVLQVNKLYVSQERKRKITSFLVSNGFYETYHLSFVKEAENLLVEEGEAGVRVLNPLSADLEYVRNSTLIPGLKTVAYNINRQQKNVKIFKWGTAFSNIENKINEKQLLSIWMTGNSHSESWHQKPSGVDFYSLKGFLEKIFAQAGIIDKISTENTVATRKFGHGLDYIYNTKKIASVGLVNKHILKELDIDQPVYFAEIEAGTLLNAKAETKYKPISRYPKMERDLSLLVPVQIQYSQIKSAVKNINKLLKNVYLFDVYEGAQVQDGYKSYAIRFEFEDSAKTLEDKAVDKIMKQVIHKLETELGIQVRA